MTNYLKYWVAYHQTGHWNWKKSREQALIAWLDCHNVRSIRKALEDDSRNGQQENVLKINYNVNNCAVGLEMVLCYMIRQESDCSWALDYLSIKCQPVGIWNYGPIVGTFSVKETLWWTGIYVDGSLVSRIKVMLQVL